MKHKESATTRAMGGMTEAALIKEAMKKAKVLRKMGEEYQAGGYMEDSKVRMVKNQSIPSTWSAQSCHPECFLSHPFPSIRGASYPRHRCSKESRRTQHLTSNLHATVLCPHSLRNVTRIHGQTSTVSHYREPQTPSWLIRYLQHLSRAKSSNLAPFLISLLKSLSLSIHLSTNRSHSTRGVIGSAKTKSSARTTVWREGPLNVFPHLPTLCLFPVALATIGTIKKPRTASSSQNPAPIPPPDSPFVETRLGRHSWGGYANPPTPVIDPKKAARTGILPTVLPPPFTASTSSVPQTSSPSHASLRPGGQDDQQPPATPQPLSVPSTARSAAAASEATPPAGVEVGVNTRLAGAAGRSSLEKVGPRLLPTEFARYMKSA